MSFVRDVLTYLIPVDLAPNQRHPLDVLLQQWYDVARRPALTEGFVELLRDADPKLRAAAVQFFVTHMAEDGGALPGLMFHLGVLDVQPYALILELKGQVPDEVLLDGIRAAMPADRERLARLVTGG
jgi:hypothetical protein